MRTVSPSAIACSSFTREPYADSTAPSGGIADPATVLPVQIFLWSDEVDRAFVEKTSAAIIVLLLFMLMMNGLAIYLRNRFERRW